MFSRKLANQKAAALSHKKKGKESKQAIVAWDHRKYLVRKAEK